MLFERSGTIAKGYFSTTSATVSMIKELGQYRHISNIYISGKALQKLSDKIKPVVEATKRDAILMDIDRLFVPVAVPRCRLFDLQRFEQNKQQVLFMQPV